MRGGLSINGNVKSYHVLIINDGVYIKKGMENNINIDKALTNSAACSTSTKVLFSKITKYARTIISFRGEGHQ